MVFPLLWNTDHLVVLVSIDSSSQKEECSFSFSDFDYFRAKWNGFRNPIIDIRVKVLSNLRASIDISEFHDYANVVYDVHNLINMTSKISLISILCRRL